jgi:prolyl-tRNA synthetase
MKFSKGFLRTKREVSKEAQSVSHQLTVRAGLAHQVSAGHYSILPLGNRVLQKIESIIREEMDAVGCLEITLPIMQPSELWIESGRWGVYGEEMFKLKNRKGHEYCLGPTHEELVVELVKNQMRGNSDFPFTLYQFGTKFRDEKRARGGLLRTREFSMKDAYSFDTDQKGLEESYETMRAAYLRIVKRMEIHAVRVAADTGEMGGQSSEEFIALTSAGEDRIILTEDGIGEKAGDFTKSSDVQTGAEIGHIFKLGTRYSEKMGLFIDTAEGRKPVEMGCYGIGVSRMLPVIIEQHHDDKGIIWPRSVAPYEAIIIPVQQDDSDVKRVTEELYRKLGSSVALFDDREESVGTKFYDANLLGIPDRFIIGQRGLKKGIVEYESRTGMKAELRIENVLEEYGRVMEVQP